MAVTPDSKTLYAANNGSRSEYMVPIGTAADTTGPLIPIGPQVDALAITPDGKTVYAASTTGREVTPVSTTANTPEKVIPVGGAAGAIAIAPARCARG
jgi:DNA-binding beta-propeller fold protein YncE